MSIDRAQTSTPIQNISALNDLRSSQQAREQRDIAGVKSERDRVSLSRLAQQATTDESRDINHARLAELRAALDAGTYSINSDHIASALVNEMLNG